jgi:drug/metabolite transporter (DMT)-like permease
MESPRTGDKLRGILFLIIAVGCFGAVDGLSKMLIDTQSFGQIMLARYALSLPLLLAVTAPGKWPELFRTQSVMWQVIRGLLPVVIGGLMVFAVTYLPLAEATVILFAGPFFVVALSGWLLGERVSLSSWIGVAVGFLAVLIVARPGFDELSHYALFPAVAAVFYALFQLLTRRLGTSGEAPVTTLAWTLVVGNLVAIPLAIADWQPPSANGWMLILGLGITFGAGQYFLAKAFALAPANVLTPFTYFQILSAVVFGMVIFHDIPDAWTFLGIAMILAAGLYVFGRNRDKKA